MGAVNTNSISLAAIRETTLGQLPASGTMEYLEPNEVGNYGVEMTTTVRAPISKYRMNKKGTITDITSTVEFTQDTTASLLLEMLEGSIYSHWLKRPHATRGAITVGATGNIPAPGFKGDFADETAATASVVTPVAGDWWNNTTDNLEWEYDGTVLPTAGYIGSFTDPAAASLAQPSPTTGDWWQNTADGFEWEYDGSTFPAPGYLGTFADETAATTAHPVPAPGSWWNNSTDGFEWEYDGTVSPAPGYVGDFADDTAAIAAVPAPVAGDWFVNTTTNTEWNWDTGTSAWVDSSDPSGTRSTTVTTLWHVTSRANGTTPVIVTTIWRATTRINGTTPVSYIRYWRASARPVGTTPSSVVSAGGYHLSTPLAGAPVENSLVFCRGFVDPANNGVKVTDADSTDTLISTVDGASLVNETGSADTSVYVVGIMGAVGDLQIDGAGNLMSTVLDFTTLGIEPGHGIFIGGIADENKFATEGNGGLCRVRTVTANRLTLDKRPNAFAEDDGAGKAIHLYLGWFIKDVAVDDPLFKDHSFAFEIAYPGIQDNGADGYEYAKGNMINTMEISLPLSDKSETSITTFGMDVDPITDVRMPYTFERPLFQEAYSTPNDFIRLRVEKTDGYGLSTLFKECTLTLNNNAGGENVLGKIGPAFTNYGNFDVSLAFTCVFTSPDIPKMIRNNCTVTMDFCIVNNDGGFYFDIPGMTLGDGTKDFAINEKVKIALTSTAFGDPEPGYTIGITFFPYIPNPKADACA